MAKDKKKQRGKRGAEPRESAQKIWLAGLGAVAAAEQGGTKLFGSLVDMGERYQGRLQATLEQAGDQARGMFREARTRAGRTADHLEQEFDERVQNTLHRIGIPTAAEIADLSERVERLAHKLSRSGRAAGDKPAAGKKAKRKKAPAKKAAGKKAGAKKKPARKSGSRRNRD